MEAPQAQIRLAEEESRSTGGIHFGLGMRIQAPVLQKPLTKRVFFLESPFLGGLPGLDSLSSYLPFGV
jgi:hypothetical protein